MRQEEVQERDIDPLVAPAVQELDGIVQCFQLGTQGGVVRGHIHSYPLGLAHGRRATDTLLGEEVAHETCELLGLLFGPLEQIRWYGDMGIFLLLGNRTMYFELAGVIVFMKVSMS